MCVLNATFRTMIQSNYRPLSIELAVTYPTMDRLSSSLTHMVSKFLILNCLYNTIVRLRMSTPLDFKRRILFYLSLARQTTCID